MSLLVPAAIVWVGLHLGIAGTRVRARLAARLGEGGFRGVYSLLSVAAIAFLIGTWKDAARVPLWFAPDWLRWLLIAAMLPAFVLFVASVTGPNPTAAGGEKTVGMTPRGITRVTRHPMLWSFAIWATVHILGNGELSALVFFGAFLVTALAGMPSIDAKIARRDPAVWPSLAAATSIVPFAAIRAGRNRFSLREIGWKAPVIGTALWLGLLLGHPHIFGVQPWPA